jgi:hypothetical protein
MAHEHAQAHRLVRRQRNAVEIVTAIEIVTVPDTGSGRVQQVTEQEDPPVRTLVPPAVRPRPSSTEEDDEPEETTTRAPPTRRPAPSTTAESTERETQRASAKETASPSLRVQSTLVVATKSPTASHPLSSVVGVVGIVSATASSTISATPSSSAAAAAASESEGMSGGAKAGLALGILLGVAFLLVGILMFYRHKKNKMAGEDNEKVGMHAAPPPPPPQVQTGAAPAAAANRFPATAPRLELRPESQFSPTFEQRKSGANVLNTAAAAGAMAQTQKLASSSGEKSPTSAWERRGAANASADPFNDESAALATSPRSQQNPFGNSAALDSNHASIPDSPLNSSPAHSSNPSADLAKSAAAPVAALAAAASIAAVTSDKSNQNAPPTANANAVPEGVPAIPEGTDSIPASPGPAPTGPPPPVVGAMAGGRPNGPPPGPNNVHRVTLDFKPSMGDELELKAGSLVRMLHEYDDGWVRLSLFNTLTRVANISKALCITMDRSQQGVVPRTCLSKHPVKPRTGPPRQGPPPPHMRGNPPIRSPMGPGGIPQIQGPMSPADGSHPPVLSPASGRMSPSPRAMSPGPRQMASPQMQQGPRGRSHSNAPYAGPQRSMSPGPYGGGPQMAPPSQMGRPRSNSANQAMGPRRGPAPGPSPMNPNSPMVGAIPSRKPVPGQAL